MFIICNLLHIIECMYVYECLDLYSSSEKEKSIKKNRILHSYNEKLYVQIELIIK